MGSIPVLPILYLLGLLRLLCFVNGANVSDASLTPVPRHLYHSCDSLLKDVKALVNRHPEKLSVDEIRAEDKGYVADIVVVTYNSYKIPKNGNLKFRILLSFGQHGRELITSEVALRLLSILTGERTMPGADLSLLNSVLDNLVIKMVPMENLNGCKHVEAGEFCERRNGRGVDLNRNWGVDWGKKEKDYDPYEENPGAGPFSEPETQIMRKLSQSFDPHVWVNVHSGMEALFMPYDHKNVTPDGIISHLMRSLLDNLNHHHCQNRCLVGSGGGSVGYLAHGTSTDHDIVKVPMAFTFEHHALSMSWFSITTTMVITLWVSSLLRVLLASSPCIPSSPAFLSVGSSATKNRRNALLVVAHPDDESMFFAPTLLYLASEGHNVHVLCLSTGNADGKGNIRKEEFYRACAILKVPLQQVQILDHPKLQDGFDKPWDIQLLAKLVEEEIRTRAIDLVITFDNYGVSGHPNHRDVHRGICVFLCDNLGSNVEAWELASTSIFRKYTGPVDVWLSTFFWHSYPGSRIYCLLNTCPSKSYLAMAEHSSQWVWYRKLFVGFSSYTYINTLRKLNF